MRRTLIAAALIVGLIAVPTAAGAGNPFSDVPDARYYAEPVAWAYENDITTGTSATTFSPDDLVTRGQVVTFLQRYHQNVVAPAIVADAAEALDCDADEVIHDTDGDWACGTPIVADGLGPFEHRTLTTGGTGGTFDAVLGGTGNPFVFQDGAIAHSCNDPLCASATMTELDADADAELLPAITLAGNGRPVVAYHDATWDGLGVMFCSNKRCTSGSVLPLASGGAGWDAEVVHDGTGSPWIVHRDEGVLKLIVCLSHNCFIATGRTPAIGSINDDIGFIRPPDKQPVLVYGSAAGGLRAYACGGSSCSTPTNTELVAGVDTLGIDVTLDSSGKPVIAYADGTGDTLGLYRCSSKDCTSGVATALPVDAATEHVSITLGAGDEPYITAIDGSGNVTLYRCADAACSSGTSDTIADDAVDAGVVLHDDGSIVVIYLDQSTGDLFAAAAEFGPHVTFD